MTHPIQLPTCGDSSVMRPSAPSRSRLAVAFLVCLGTAAGLTGCGAPSAATPAPVTVAALTLVDPPVASRAICLDPTGSTPAQFSRTVRELLARRVEAWVRPVDEARERDGLAGQAGLDLWVRTVATKSFSSNTAGLHLVVPGIAELPPRPDTQSSEGLDEYQKWKRLRDTVRGQRVAAVDAAAAAARALRGLVLDTHTSSGITGCMSALASVVPPTPDRKFALASDLLDNQPMQSAGGFDGAPVQIIQACPSGEAAVCAAAAARFTDWLTKQGAAVPPVARPEVAEQVFAAWLGGGP